MSLHIIHSNRVENLLDDLSYKIAIPHPQAGFLDGEVVLLDNPVLGKWLNLQLAGKNKIAANIQYVQLSRFFWDLARSLLSAYIPKHAPLDKVEMTWRLMGLLENEQILESTALKPVKAYLAGDKFTDLKRYQLAVSVADLFDQYLIYRPDWINKYWDKNKNITLAGEQAPGSLWQSSEAWQKVLWAKMVEPLDDSNAPHHRADILISLLKTLEGDLAANALKFHRLFVFGVTSMPESQIDLLMLLGKHIDISLYVLNPCEHEWFGIRSHKQVIKLEQSLWRKHEADEVRRKREVTELSGELEFMEVGNPLLAGQAVQVQEFIELIYEKTDNYQEQSKIESFEGFEDPGQETLLDCIQKEILELQYRGEVAQLKDAGGDRLSIPEREFKPADQQFPSIHIHNCHSPQREVEVLHDQLLDLFNKDKSLRPRDVVVMMPKVAPYVPFINSVFESATNNHRIKYHISDRTLQEESPILNSFETLLKLPDSRLPLSEILGLFEVPAVHRRFGLDRDAFEQLKSWLIASGARWGIDATHRKQTGLPAYSDFSWDFGMTRLLAGYAMQADIGSNDDNEISGLLQMTSSEETEAGFNIIPMDEVEGGGAEVLDGFLRFWAALKVHRKQLRQSRSPAEWKVELEKLIEDFYRADDDDWRALNELRRGFDELELAADKANEWYKGKLPLEVIRAMIQPVLNQPGSKRHPWSEGVKFCSLLPMRGVPFKVVYLLGMNMDDYPRRIVPKSFDLMRNNYKPGDRSARTDDRWLFLEALLSARDAFYVSFVGQDMHRNEKREPSVVLSELIDYIRDGYGLPEGAGVDEPFAKRELQGNSFLYTKHPLQPFNPSYFHPQEGNDPSRLFSFKQQAYEVANGQLLARSSEPPSGDQRWQQAETLEDAEVLDVNLDEFVKFFTQPWNAFFKKQGVGLSRYDEEVSDEELFELQLGLGSWKLRDSLLSQAARSQLEPSAGNLDLEIASLVAHQKASGAWPIGSAAKKEIEKLKKLPPEYVFLLSGKNPESIQIDLPIELDLSAGNSTGSGVATLRISGALKRFDDEFLVQSASSVSEKYLLDFYIRLALASAAENFEINTAEAVFLNKDKDRIAQSYTMMGGKRPLSFDDGFISDEQRHQALLKNLASLHLAYREHGLPFHPKLSLKAFDDEDELSKAVETEWFGGGYATSMCIKDDVKQRAYYGSPSALMSDTFIAVGNDVRSAVEQWLESGEQG